MDVAQQAHVQVRGEERLRSGSDIDSAETEIGPQLRYDAIWRRGQDHFVALYQPRFIYSRFWGRELPDPNLVNPATLNLDDPNATPFSALHNGGVGYEAIRPRYRVSLYQFAAYGPISTTALLVQAPWTGAGPPPDPNPIIPSTIGARFRLLFAQTQLFVPIRLSPRTALTPGFVYNAFGGADRTSRGVIALTHGPGVTLELEHAPTPNDRLITTIGGGQVSTMFQDEREGALILRSEAKQAWRHWYSENLSSEIVGGASLGGDAISGYSIYSLAQASLLWDSWPQQKFAPGAPPWGWGGGRERRLQIGAVVKVQPWIDLFSGDLEQRAVLSAATNYTVGRSTFRGALSHARVLPTPRSVASYQIVLGEGGLTYRLTRTLTADATLRAGYQSFDNAVRFNELTQFTVSAGVTWAPLPARF